MMDILKCFIVEMYVVCAADYFLEGRKGSGLGKLLDFGTATFLIGMALLVWSKGL